MVALVLPKQDRVYGLDPKVAEKLSESVVALIKRYNLPVIDGKYVRMVKVTKADGTSASNSACPPLKYEVGKQVVAKDYTSTPACGHGLHFSPTAEMCRSNMGYHSPGKSFVVDVDLATAVTPTGSKIKAQFCKVIAEGDEKSFAMAGDLPLYPWT